MSFDTDEYERGQRDGANSSTLGELGIALNITSSKHYVLGFQNGAANKRRNSWTSSPESATSHDFGDGAASTILLFCLFICAAFVTVIQWIILIALWIFSSPRRVAVGLLLAVVIVVLNSLPYKLPPYLDLSVAPVALPTLLAPVEVPRPLAASESQPIAETSALSNPTFVPLGHFSDGTYEIELYRDDEASSQVIGLIISFSPDSTKITVGEILDVVGTGSDGPLSFRTTWADYMPYFRGSLKGDEIEGDYETSFEREPRHIIFQRVENPTTTGVYANREEWSKHLAELLACCGQDARPDEPTDQ